jgi:CheY-like chemotaxis protein
MEKRKKRLLIVDDDPGALALFRAALDGEFAVETAAGGEAGVEAAVRGGPDVVLLDYAMPRVDGSKVLARLRMEAATRDVPVVVFSASRLDAPTRRALAEHPSVRRLLDKVTDFRSCAAALREAAAS